MDQYIFSYKCQTCGEIYKLKVTPDYPNPKVEDLVNRNKGDHFCKGEFIGCESFEEKEDEK